MKTFLILLMVGLAFAAWFVLQPNHDCGDNGYLENGICTYA